jgi:hypothetical protein
MGRTRTVEITGVKYNMLTAISYEGNGSWKFKCDCGNIVVKAAFDVKNGKVKACMRSCLSYASSMITKHPLYNTWKQIQQRCYRPKVPNYKYYGGRGIKMSESWKNDFWTFVKDMGEKPSKNFTVERLNNDEDYSKENCIWATTEEQAANRRSNVYVFYKDVKYSFTQICKLFKLNRSNTYSKYRRSMLPVQEYFDKNIF